MPSMTEQIMETAINVLRGQEPYCAHATASWESTSARVIEVPWTAGWLRRARPQSLLDVGLSLASLDYLGLLLAYREMGNTLNAVDIVRPERVQSRYPEGIRKDVLSVPVLVGDIRSVELPPESYDMVTMISVIEHVGFDMASEEGAASAFARADCPQEVNTRRVDGVDGQVLGSLMKTLKKGGAASGDGSGRSWRGGSAQGQPRLLLRVLGVQRQRLERHYGVPRI